MSHFKRTRINTTVGELVTALSEAVWPFSKSEREASLVVSYIINDLLERFGCTAHRNARDLRRRSGRRGRSTNDSLFDYMT